MSVDSPENQPQDSQDEAAQNPAPAFAEPPAPRKIRIGTERDPDAKVENRAARLYFIHERGALMEWDRMLLERGDIKTKGRILAQFYPQELRQDLLSKEQARLGGRSLSDVLKTVFGVRAKSDGGMEFYVVEQTYR